MRVLQGLLLTAASVVLCLLVLEVGLRLFWTGYYQKYYPDRPWDEFDFHPTRGFSLGPNLEMVDWDTDFKVTRKHNSHGFRSPEIPIQKPADRTRVMVIGDSFVYGIGVENDEAFPQQLEKLVPSLQVINAGVPAYSGAEELVELREEIGIWKPDIVIAAYFWNDLFGAYPGGYVKFELRDGELHQIPPNPASPDHPAFAFHRKRFERKERRYNFITSHSYAYRLLSDRIKIVQFALKDWWHSLRPKHRDGTPDADRSEEGPAWQLSFALLREMWRVSEAHGAKFLLVVIPDSVQVEPDADVYGIPPFLPEVQEKVVGFATSEGIPVFDPLPVLRAMRQNDGLPQYFPTDRHWNKVGHHHMATLLRAELKRRGWIDAHG